jgi:hypothetical protein
MIDNVEDPFECFNGLVSSMRVDPKHLRGFHEIGISLILIVGAGGLIGAASVSSLWKRPSSVKTVPVSGMPFSGVVGVAGGGAEVEEVSPVLPGAGARVAVSLSLEKRSSVLLFSDVRVVGGGKREIQLDVTDVQKDILQHATMFGSLAYRVIPDNEVSPYSGQDIKCMADLEYIIGR